MNKQTTSVSHHNATYNLKIGGWLQHLNSKASEAILQVATEDIILPNGQSVDIYKTEKRSEYNTQATKLHSSAKKHLNSCSHHDFGLDWDKLIGTLKQEINNTCIPLLMAKRKLSKAENHKIRLAASNGHVSAMYWIGTALRDIKDDNCLLWLSMAHNRGHVGACYEMAAHLKSKSNHIEALRCLIVSADGGCDLAYMSIFHFDILSNLFKIKEISLLENMLDELAATQSSSARYFKSILLLSQGKKTEGRAALAALSKNPKKQVSKNNIDVTYELQIKTICSFVEDILAKVDLGAPPLDAIQESSKQRGFLTIEDYDELTIAVNKMQFE